MFWWAGSCSFYEELIAKRAEYSGEVLLSDLLSCGSLDVTVVSHVHYWVFMRTKLLWFVITLSTWPQCHWDITVQAPIEILYPMQKYIIFSRQDNAELLICIYLLHFDRGCVCLCPAIKGWDTSKTARAEKLTFRVARSPCPLSSAILKTRTSTRLARCLVFSVKNPLKEAIKEMNWKLISIHQNIHQKIYS